MADIKFVEILSVRSVVSKSVCIQDEFPMKHHHQDLFDPLVNAAHQQMISVHSS